MLFKVYSSNGKILGSRTDNKIFLKPNLSTSLPSLDMGGWGDPHMTLRMSGGGILSTWDDNAPGSQNTEILFLHLETNTDKVSVFYTNKLWGVDPNDSPKTINSVKYIHNGTIVSGFTGTTKIGPVQLTYTPPYDLHLRTDYIPNIKNFGGGAAIALTASANANGYINGGWGRMNDGYSILGSGLGAIYNRNNLVVGNGVTIDNSGNVSCPVIFNTTGSEAQRVLGFVNAHFTGSIAAEIGLPLNPVALQLANIQAPGGNFDGLVNPPSITGGIIDASGTIGSGLGYYGADGIPANLSYIGNYSGINLDTNTDIYIDNVALSLHMDGSNSGTVFTDSSSFSRSAINSGNVITSTNKIRAGSSSAYFSGPNNGSRLVYNSFPSLGSGDFTLECWVYFQEYDAGEGSTHIMGQHWSATSNNWLLGIVQSDYLHLDLVSSDGYYYYPSTGVSTTGTVTYNAWRHLAAVRHNGDIKLFINGQMENKGSFPYAIANTLPLTIGGDYSGTNCMKGYIDELRITTGVARYTGNFDPDLYAFPYNFVTSSSIGQPIIIRWE